MNDFRHTKLVVYEYVPKRSVIGSQQYYELIILHFLLNCTS